MDVGGAVGEGTGEGGRVGDGGDSGAVGEAHGVGASPVGDDATGEAADVQAVRSARSSEDVKRKT